MRNRLRVAAFDVLAPVAVVAALIYLGVALGWPLWWVSVCSVLCVLVVEGVLVNAVLARRDKVTVGTDDDGPGLRLAVTATASAAVVAAALAGYLQWTLPDRAMQADTDTVTGIASSVAEASATFTPQNPTGSIDRAVAMMSDPAAERFRNEFAQVAEDLAGRNVSAQASTVSAGVEAIGPRAASVAVILRGTQNRPGEPTDTAVLALRVALSKVDGHWVVEDVSPIHTR
ncbi:MAG: hypothetical protein SW019_01950 [Actinomycetota bacterium]|nr:hypothetical protein [Actinomycetota bacterium]